MSGSSQPIYKSLDLILRYMDLTYIQNFIRTPYV